MQTKPAFQIIKNAEPPRRGVGKLAIYPFQSMEIGDAFDAPLPERAHLSNSINYWQKRYGSKFTTRRMSDDTVRCWRIA